MRTNECPACNSEPANHFSLWLSSTGDILTQAMPVKYLPFSRLLTRVGEAGMSALGRIFFTIGRVLNVIKLTSDTSSAVNQRSRLLWEEANRRGIQVEQLLFFGTATDSFRITHTGRTYFFKSLPFMPPGEALRMDDKVHFKKTLLAAGLPAARSFSASSLSDARKILEKLGLVCVKPRSGSNGRHTYPHVRTQSDLAIAWESAKQICAFASVEEHLEGNLCRATCVDGVMHGFLECRYPAVVGDGSSTVRELIEKRNEERPAGVGEIKLSPMHHAYIARRGYDEHSVVPKDELLPLTYRAGPSSGGGNREHGRAIHPSFIEPIERAAKLTGLSIVGFDIIIPDPHAPADSQRWGFVEANSLPWIDLHATPYSGDPIDLSGPVWDLWEARHPARGTR
jgi:hypothetical protein